MIALLLACVHPVPPVLPPAVERLEVPARPAYVDAPGDCSAVDVRPGWVADCSGIAISDAATEHVGFLEEDLAVARLYLAEVQALAALERAHFERVNAEIWTRAQVAERDARVLRAVVPLAFGGGLMIGAGVAVGVLAAADGVTR